MSQWRTPYVAYARGGPRWYKGGTLSVAAFPVAQQVDNPGQQEKFRCRVGTAPIGAAIVVDLKKNGVVIATCTIPAGSTEATTTGFSDVTVNAGDLFNIDITQVGSSVAGSDLMAEDVIRLDATDN